ncbi:hypothetical protein L6R53_33150 [Myxococcota bacterium]|nr:hypothetical protein [Myxococcota bacterium]
MARSPTRRAALAALGALPLALPLVGACAGRHRYDLVVRQGPARGAPAPTAVAPALLLHAGQLDLAPQGATVQARPYGVSGVGVSGVGVSGVGAAGNGAAGVGAAAGADPSASPSAADPAATAALLDVFYANLYVGKIWHGGGYDMLPEVGNQVRSLGLTFSHQRAYAEQVLSWVDQALAELLAAADAPLAAVPASVEAALQPPRRTSLRGTQGLDGEDNQNLPGFTLQPQPLDPALLPAGITASRLLVPLVVHYYAHNGGWFVGQAQGCPAGARFRLLWVLHEVATGAVLTWGDLSARYVEPYFYSPNDTQLQDYLLQVEARMKEALAETLVG